MAAGHHGQGTGATGARSVKSPSRASGKAGGQPLHLGEWLLGRRRIHASFLLLISETSASAMQSKRRKSK